MPQIKKKGAIFAIYADSPTKATTPTTKPRKTTRSEAAKTSGENAPLDSAKIERRSSTKKTTSRARSGSNTTSRKPLASVQSRPLSIRTERSKDNLKACLEKPVQLPPSTSKRDSAAGSHGALPKSSSKRQLSSPSPSPRDDVFTSGPTVPSTSRASLRTPAKKARAASSAAVVEKENVLPPGLDSPASRTRSKTGPLPDVDIEVLEREAEALVGDGRGAMSLKKGREVAKLMGSSRKAGKGLAVLPDGALCDVSEAYGASGAEPEGFKKR